jgi:hypothetical protein
LGHREWVLERRAAKFAGAAKDAKLLRSRPKWELRQGGVSIAAWVSRFDRDLSPVSPRHVTFVLSQEDETLAVATFSEWTSGGLVFLTELVQSADMVSAEDYECSLTIRDNWSEESSPLDYGNIVMMHRLVIKRPNPDIWPAIRKGIERQFLRRGALFILKAFPLEWEGQGEPDRQVSADPNFASRLRAMKRHYANALGVMSVIPGDGHEWLWKPLRYCPEPDLISLTAPAVP